MNMTGIDLLTFARGTAFNWALGVLIFGLLLRMFEMLSLGRKPDLSEPRAVKVGSGLRTLFTRSLPPPGMVKRSPVTYVGGYVFHIGFALVLLLFVPHIEVFRAVLGLHWPGLPTPVIDAIAVASMAAMLIVLIHRLTDKVKRFLSGFGDYLAWALTFLPLLTGYLALHHLLFDYTWMLALHILSVEALMVLLPFTKLTHTVTVFFARWYNGEAFARKGVAS